MQHDNFSVYRRRLCDVISDVLEKGQLTEQEVLNIAKQSARRVPGAHRVRPAGGGGSAAHACDQMFLSARGFKG